MGKPIFSHATVFNEHGLLVAGQSFTAASTMTSGDEVVPVDGTGGAFALNIPFAASRRGRQIYFVKVDAVANVTLTRQGTDVIGFAGATTVVMNTQDQVVHLVSDGVSRWIRLQ